MEVFAVIAGLVALGVVALGVQQFRANFRDGYRRGRMKTVAKVLSEGGKPWGEPTGGTSHGGAYFLDTKQVVEKGYGRLYSETRNGEIINNMLLLGDHSTIGTSRGKEIDREDAQLYAPKEGHLITVAPTRTGKGTCHLVTNLMNYDEGSIVVNDIKGENAGITETWRKDLSDACYRFSPFFKRSAHWNPLDFIRMDANMADDVAFMVDMLIVASKGEAAFWDEEGKNLLRGVILHVVQTYPDGERNMAKVRELLTLDADGFDRLLDSMGRSDDELVRRAANTFQRKDVKVQSGILAALDSQMGVWDSRQLKRYMGKSDFRFEDLKEEIMTVYFCIPPERLSANTRVMRLFFGQAIAAMTRNPKKPFAPVVFFLDEFPQLGRMKPIEEGLAYLAGYGVRLWLFAQDLGQIKSIYGDMTQSILANCAVRTFFGTSDPETAKMVSEMCGTMTVPVDSFGQSESMNTIGGQGTLNSGVGFSGRPLMTPQEVMSMDRQREQLVFIQGENPVLAYKRSYLEQPAIVEYCDTWDPAAQQEEVGEDEAPFADEIPEPDLVDDIEESKEVAIEERPPERPVDSSERKSKTPRPPAFDD